MFRQGFDDLKVIGVAAIPTPHSTASQAYMRVTDNTVRIEELCNAKAVTTRAGAIGVVEREHSRFDFLQAVIAVNAGVSGTQKFLRHGPTFFHVLHRRQQRESIGQYQRGFKRLGKPLFQIGPYFKAVNDNFNGMVPAQFEYRHIIDRVYHPVDTHTHVTLRTQLIK